MSDNFTITYQFSGQQEYIQGIFYNKSIEKLDWEICFAKREILQFLSLKLARAFLKYLKSKLKHSKEYKFFEIIYVRPRLR